MEFYLIMNHQEVETFVTRKITIGLSKIKKGIMKTLYLGNLDAKKIGDMLKIMCRRCGKFYNKIRLMIMLLQLAKLIQLENLLKQQKSTWI